MKVYIIRGISKYHYDPIGIENIPDDVVRIFSSKKVAQQFVEKYQSQWEELKIDEWEVEKEFDMVEE